MVVRSGGNPKGTGSEGRGAQREEKGMGRGGGVGELGGMSTLGR